MTQNNKTKKQRTWIEWHPVGQRIVKTAAAVTLCLFFYMLRGYQGETMPAEAAITAIICMQPYVHGTRENALTRLSGTVIGAFWGFLFLLLMLFFPPLGKNLFVLYALMGVGTLITLHSTVLIRQSEASGLAAIVFVCVVIAYPDITNPMDQAFHRILDVLLGTAVALGVNAIRLPGVRQHQKAFFVRMKDLAPDQFAHLSAPVLFRLQALFQEEAKICLMSEHAPSFQTSQLGSTKLTLPMIVMDGAAIYDANDNEYLSTTTLDPASCRWLVKRLNTLHDSYFIYTVHQNRNCIFHHGQLTEPERTVYQHLKRSPYRYYLDDDHYSASDVVYIKIVTDREEAERVQRDLAPVLEKMKIRSVIRSQAGLEKGCSLYFYASHADMRHAQEHLVKLLRQKDENLEVRDMVPQRDYRTEHDAVQLLKKVYREYSPSVFSVWLKGRKKAGAAGGKRA